MKQLKVFIAALAITITAGALAQQSGGFPSRPRFQTVTALVDGQQYILNQSTASADQKNWILRTGGSPAGTFAISTATDAAPNIAINNAITITRTGTTVTDVTTNGTSIFAVDSGPLTWSFTTAQNPNCSAGGTNATVQLRKRGALVTMSVTSFGTCSTAGATSFTTNNAPVPAAFRPATSAGGCGVIEGGNATGNAIVAVCVNTAGNFIVANPGGSTTLIQIASQMSTTYSLD